MGYIEAISADPSNKKTCDVSNAIPYNDIKYKLKKNC